MLLLTIVLRRAGPTVFDLKPQPNPGVACSTLVMRVNLQGFDRFMITMVFGALLASPGNVVDDAMTYPSLPAAFNSLSNCARSGLRVQPSMTRYSLAAAVRPLGVQHPARPRTETASTRSFDVAFMWWGRWCVYRITLSRPTAADNLKVPTAIWATNGRCASVTVLAKGCSVRRLVKRP
jgi:hypothetical protein